MSKGSINQWFFKNLVVLQLPKMASEWLWFPMNQTNDFIDVRVGQELNITHLVIKY